MTDKTIRDNFTTPAFRLSYPSLFETTPDMNGNPKYSVTMLFPKKQLVEKMLREGHPAARYMAADNCAGFWQAVVKILKANFGPEAVPQNYKVTAFRDGDQPKQNGKVDENARGYIWTKATANPKNPPKCILQDKTVLNADNGELYAGCWCRAILTISPFVKGSRGVTYYLAGVQKIADDTPFSGRVRVEDEFDEVAGAASGMAMNPVNGEASTSAPAPAVATPTPQPWEV